jgi:pyridoxine 5-phosphate synthase
MTRLSLNIDHVATLREARKGRDPEPLSIALLAELAGVDGITVHLRQDRRHIQVRDLRWLRELVRTELNLEMAPVSEMINLALEVKPDRVTLVPETPEEITTEGGIDCVAHRQLLISVTEQLHRADITVNLFIDPDSLQIEAAKEIGADGIEINTAKYSEANTAKAEELEGEKVQQAASLAAQSGLKVHAGHGLNYRNVKRIARISEIQELSIGHSIIARAVFIGIQAAVQEMLRLIKG